MEMTAARFQKKPNLDHPGSEYCVRTSPNNLNFSQGSFYGLLVTICWDISGPSWSQNENKTRTGDICYKTNSQKSFVVF